MAEIFLSPIIQVLFEKLISSDLIKFAREEKVHTSVNKWKEMVETIEAVLNDAEDKQITNPAVKKWLGKLQFLAHDAEDILDLFATEILRRKLIAETQASTSKFKLQSIIPTCCTSFRPSAVRFNATMGSKIDEITTGFQELLAQKRDLELMVHPGGASSRTRERQATPTTSVPESHVYGRENEKAAILELVLSGKSSDDHGVSVIPIVGLGGVGKTTIARLVYNDDRLEGYFNLKAWVCVSDEEKFDIIWVTKAILESFTKQAPDVTTLNSLQERLVEKLSKQKFLLVLDDVWLENYEDWTALRRPLEGGTPGSKIIVTTRNERVSSLTGFSRPPPRCEHGMFLKKMSNTSENPGRWFYRCPAWEHHEGAGFFWVDEYHGNSVRSDEIFIVEARRDNGLNWMAVAVSTIIGLIMVLIVCILVFVNVLITLKH